MSTHVGFPVLSASVPDAEESRPEPGEASAPVLTGGPASSCCWPVEESTPSPGVEPASSLGVGNALELLTHPAALKPYAATGTHATISVKANVLIEDPLFLRTDDAQARSGNGP